MNNIFQNANEFHGPNPTLQPETTTSNELFLGYAHRHFNLGISFYYNLQDNLLIESNQPINFVRSDAPPMLLVHGLNDDTVKPKNSRNFAAALRALGVPVTLKLYPRLSHADTVVALTALLRGRAPTLADIREFVAQDASV